MEFAIQTVINALSLGALYAVISLGVALIFGVMRLVNFAHGTLIMLGAYAVWALSGFGWLAWALGALLVVGVAAVAMERVAFRPLRYADLTTLLVASFMVYAIMQETAFLFAGGLAKSVSLPGFLTESASIGGISIGKLSILTIGVGGLSLGAVATFLRRTSVGVEMRAAAENIRMARLLGVRANRVIAWAFALSGILAGLAGVLLVAQLGRVTPEFGLEPVIVGFVATVIGGMGSLQGAALGGIVLGVTTVFLQAWLPADAVGYRDALVYATVIAILVVRPQGLLGTRERLV